MCAGRGWPRQRIIIRSTTVRASLICASGTMGWPMPRASVLAMSFVAESARGIGQPMVPEAQINEARTVVERMMIRWRGQPRPAHIKAVDAYFVSAAEHGMNASTFTARVVASTGADIAACLSSAVGALSGPLHGGAPTAEDRQA